jgi:hypothetical protein
MSLKRVLDRPSANKIEIAHIEDGNLTIEDRYNLEPTLDLARYSRDAGEGQGKDMRLAAHVPQDVLDRALREGWYSDPAAWKRWLNDPQNKPFRVWGGRA